VQHYVAALMMQTHHGLCPNNIMWTLSSGGRGSNQTKTRQSNQLALCTAALLPELKPTSCFLSAIIGQVD